MKQKSTIKQRLYGLAVLNGLLLIVLTFLVDWQIAIALGIALVFNIRFCIYLWRTQQKEFLIEKSNLKHEVEQVGNYVFDHMPLGIILYEKDLKVKWTNAYTAQIFGRNIHHANLTNLSENLAEKVTNAHRTFHYESETDIYLVRHLKDERVLYFDRITEHQDLIEQHEKEKATLGLIVMDNYEEVIKYLDEQQQNDYRRAVVDKLASWANSYGILFRTFRDGRYAILMTQEILDKLCENKFSILDEIKELGTGEAKITISMGISVGHDNYVTLFTRATSFLDLALSRGGDQVVVKKKDVNDFMFFGGKTNPVSIASRVRARVNAGAYERLVLESDRVVIMGHRFPDADAIGAGIGLLKVARNLEKEAHIVLNTSELDKANEIFVDEVLKNEALQDHFISSKTAIEKMTENSLLVIVDTQEKNLVIDVGLLRLTKKVAIFDHHRRGINHIDATLSYTDPSVSSTCELVVEMFDYFSKDVNLSGVEASIMLSGIMLDTRRFMYHTSRKTYEAAAVLKQKGADESYVSQLLKAPIDHYYSRAQLTHAARVFEEDYVIAAAHNDIIFDRTEIAATADDLLNVKGIKASFVLGHTDKETVAISARSTGEVNVQVIMEALGGGGHLNNAATAFKGTVKEATAELETAILNAQKQVEVER